MTFISCHGRAEAWAQNELLQTRYSFTSHIETWPFNSCEISSFAFGGMRGQRTKVCLECDALGAPTVLPSDSTGKHTDCKLLCM